MGLHGCDDTDNSYATQEDRATITNTDY